MIIIDIPSPDLHGVEDTPATLSAFVHVLKIDEAVYSCDYAIFDITFCDFYAQYIMNFFFHKVGVKFSVHILSFFMGLPLFFRKIFRDPLFAASVT